MKRLRDMLFVIAWGVLLYVAVDAWWQAHRSQHELIEWAALAWIGTMLIGGIAGAIIYMRVSRWNQRFDSEQCPACGYDMRATPHRCPECGFEVVSSESSLPAWLRGTALDLARQRWNRPGK